jgi:hypothetical protein
MPIYSQDTQLYACLQSLFTVIEKNEPAATTALLKVALSIRFNCYNPDATITINAQRAPVEVIYGPTIVKPAIEVNLSADTLHCLLLGQLRLSKAIGSDLMEMTGPVWKTLSLADVFHCAQNFYPAVLRESGLPTDCPHVSRA